MGPHLGRYVATDRFRGRVECFRGIHYSEGSANPHIHPTDMRTAIKDLLQLSDARLFEQVATGIRLVVEHAESLESIAVRLIAIDEHRGATIVRALAKEESAKVLILVDLIRCPRNDQDAKGRTVAAFRDHLAKEIYGNSCRWRPVDFAEVTGIVNRERQPYYLDGPNDVDWIFPNDAQGRSLVVARALHRVGMTTPEGLAVVADLWRGFEPQPQTTRQELFERNWDSLVQVSEAQQNREVDPEDARSVCHHWPFPLWPLDLKQEGPTKAALRRQRAEQIKWHLKRESERDPAPSASREKVEKLTSVWTRTALDERVGALGRAAAAASASHHWRGHSVADGPGSGSPRPRWVPCKRRSNRIIRRSHRSNPAARSAFQKPHPHCRTCSLRLLAHRLTTAVVSYDHDAITRHKIDGLRSTVHHRYNR